MPFFPINSWYYKGMEHKCSASLFWTNAHDISSVTFFLSKKGHYQDKKYWGIFVKKEQQYLLIMSILISQSSARSLHYSASLANLSNFVFQKFNIHEKCFPSILNDENDVLHIQGCLTLSCLLSHFHSII